MVSSLATAVGGLLLTLGSREEDLAMSLNYKKTLFHGNLNRTPEITQIELGIYTTNMSYC